MKAKHIGIVAMLVLSVGLGSGCAHQLEVKNLNSYRNMQMMPLEEPLTIGVVPSTSDSEAQRLMKGVGMALQKRSATVLLPYTPGSARKADVVAAITIRSEYKGSAWNFLINWPGFLVWAPAWNGFVYEANYSIDVALTKGTDNRQLDSWSTPISLNLRHADIDRTWTEIGWLEWGVIPLIGAIVFIQYDADVTPILMDKIEGPISDFIAQEIITRVNGNCGVSHTAPMNQATTVAATPERW